MHQTERTAPLCNIPLVSADEAAQGLAYIQNLYLSDHQTLPIEQGHVGLFALTINDHAMSPRFYPGYVAVIDSTRVPLVDDYVLVYFPELQKSLLRRLAGSGEQQYLLAHAQGYDTINLYEKKPEEYVILGVVVNTLMSSLLEEQTNETTSTISNKFFPQTA